MQRSRKKKRPSLNLANPRFEVGGAIVGPVTAPPVRYKKSAVIQKQLLDTAEYLFARWGYAAVSIRDVTSLARMRVANVSYYFGSKQNLYYEVLRRRAEPLSRMRLERIKAARALKMNQGLKLLELVAAYADPPLELSQGGDVGWKNFFSLIGQVTFSGFAAPQIAEFFNEPARQLMAGLYDLYPSAPAAKVQAAALMLIGPYIMVIAETGRIETFPERAFSSGDLTLLGPMMKEFIVGGIREMLHSPGEKTRRQPKRGGGAASV
ncbi:MAG: TetR/AcrR family transcriptional regulator [Xanthobacteraceae bacterium]